MTIYIFTEGDASKLSAWSNVPYFLSTTLEKMGHRVVRVDISTMNFVRKVYNHTISKLLEMLFPQHAYQFERAGVYNRRVEKILKQTMTQASDADLFIIMNFSFYNKWNQVPTITFSDWSYDYYIKVRCKRKPYFFERHYLLRQEEAIEHATVVVSLFEECARYMQKQFSKAHVRFLGGNVVNAMLEPQGEMTDIIERKRREKLILFIGMKKYISGAQLLVDAFHLIKKRIPDATLHVVGLVKNDLQNLTDGVYCYGYLHKDDESESKLYYDLLQKASLFVNPTEHWAGYSSMVEAMYYYTPIVVSPYQEFVGEFGADIDFGRYNMRFNANSLADTMLDVLMSDVYVSFCENAHERVKDYTWSSYVERFLKTAGL